MLSLKLIASNAVDYYSNLGEAENQDYYSEGGSRPGAWWGEGAAALGLSGDVKPHELGNLLDGHSPDGKKNLVKQRSGKTARRAGIDFTFTMPKSFSVARSQASPELRKQMDERARAAVYKTLDVVQELCGISRRGADGVVKEKSKLIAAIFSHDTARNVPGEAPDPNKHFHCVVVNTVVRESDASTGALYSRPIFRKRMKMALGALMRLELSKQLGELGFETFRPKQERTNKLASWFELSCVPKSFMEAMSKRRRQIENWLRERGLSGAKAAETAALRTRQAKSKYSERELYAEWRRQGAEFGFTEAEVEAALVAQKQMNASQAANSAFSRAVSILMQNNAFFTEIELLEKVAVEAQCTGLGISDVQNQIDCFVSNSSGLVRLKNENGVRRFTTKEMLAIEGRMLETSKELFKKLHHSISHIEIDRALSKYPTVRAEQAQAIKGITSGGDLACLQGVAGSGKTYALGIAREIWERQGFEVIGTALAAKATKGLEQGSGIKSSHIHKLLNDIEHGRLQLSFEHVLVVDECGMVSTRQLEKLIARAGEAGAKIVLVGDWDQLTAIEAGGGLKAVAKLVGYERMEEVIRQKEDWAKQVVHDFRKGAAFQALKALSERDQLFIGDFRDDAMDELVRDWKSRVRDSVDLKETLVFAGTNVEVRELNRRLQLERKRAGELGEVSVEVDGFDMHVGDRVMVTRNNASLCLQNGTFADVVSIDGTTLGLQLETGMTVEVDAADFEHLTLGLAISVHKSQGLTCRNALAMCGDSMTDREISYVQGSRAREFTKFYSDIASGGETIEELAALMNRSRQKELAHEYLIEAAAS